MDSCAYRFSSSFRAISPLNCPPLQSRSATVPIFSKFSGARSCRISSTMRTYMAEPTSDFSYNFFLEFALKETEKHAELIRSPLQVESFFFSISIWFNVARMYLMLAFSIIVFEAFDFVQYHIWVGVNLWNKELYGVVLSVPEFGIG